MEELFKDISEDIEYNILNKMVEELEQLSLNKSIKEYIKKAFDLISNTINEDSLKKLESRIDTYNLIDQKSKKDILGLTIKDCMLRMPGKILIDIDRPVKFLSIAEKREEKERSDGTRIFSECILVPSVEHNRWNTSYKTKNLIPLLESSLKEISNDNSVLVYFFPVTGEQNYNEAKNLFSKLAHDRGLFWK